MLNKNIAKLNYFVLNLFKIKTFSYYYIKYFFLIYKSLTDILSIVCNNYEFSKKKECKKYFISYFKYLKFNKKTYYSDIIASDTKYIAFSSGFSSDNLHTYIIQKNFSFYYSMIMNINKKFIISTKPSNTIKVMGMFKIILFNLFFYNVKVIIWGTKEFEDEVNAINEIFCLDNFSNINVSTLINTNLFTSNRNYNLEIHHLMRAFSKATRRNVVFLVLQNTGNGSFIIQRFKYFSIGCLTNLKLKHTYSFLIPVHINYLNSKFYMYAFVFSYRSISYRYQLVYFMMYFIKYKIMLKLC